MKTEEKNRTISNTLKQSPAAPQAGNRAETVARGKALIADPNYPSASQMAKVANILAAKWQAGTLNDQLPECVSPSEPDFAPDQNVSLGCRTTTAVPSVPADTAD